MDPRLERLRTAALFDRVEPALVDAVLQSSTARELRPGERLLRAGEPNRELYLILAGSLSVRAGNMTQPHLQLGVGDCVGELSVIDPSRVSADVVATEPTVVIAIGRPEALALVDASAEASRNLLKILTRRIRDDDVALAESERGQLELAQIALIDATTGLRNRRWFDMAFERQLARSLGEGQPVALLMIDLDNFKDVNDRRGHTAGDAVLRQIARQLGDALRPQDLIARYGGDEFAVLLPNMSSEQAMAVAERLRLQIKPAVVDARESELFGVTISVGVASTLEVIPLQALVARADAALSRAKRAGRNRVSL